ncbi:efflux RND transporter periplasmic adaptor subunit [Photobacterium salinisoli]|uniref:efflux RND transporter periplasmic adaptor subunit n=1 Tax=Photobacterium salinisoli TaxID=1616783 RepID=UPI000EA2FD3D|nr:HlyD family efflux transporter periplasmic adaptor subunit [Photobacterium salinisoli]
MLFRKHRWTLILIFLLMASLVFAFWPRPITVEIAVVTQGPMTETVDDDAITRLKDVYIITAPVSGRLLRIDKDAGDDVTAGTVLAVMQPAVPPFLDGRTQLEHESAIRAAAASRDVAKAQIKSALARLEYARIDFKRAGKLAEKDAVSLDRQDQARQFLYAAEAALASAESVLLQREAEYKLAQAAMLQPAEAALPRDDKVEITAPVNGKVLRVFQESEAVVIAGTALMETGEPGNLEIVADLLSRDAVRIAPGDLVEIDNWGGEGVLSGIVRLIEPAGTTKVSSLGIEEQRVNVIIDLTDPKHAWAALGHGFQVDVRIAVWHEGQVLRVPIGAIFRIKRDWAVFRNDDGRARLQVIQLGHMTDQYAEVLEGLSAGDQVIAYPSDRIQDGVLIRAIEPAQ